MKFSEKLFASTISSKSTPSMTMVSSTLPLGWFVDVAVRAVASGPGCNVRHQRRHVRPNGAVLGLAGGQAL